MSCSGKRTRIKNLLVNAQTADAYEAPAASQNLRLDSGFVAQATPEAIARDILKSSYTPEVDLMGIKVATMTGVSEMFGANYTDGTTKPAFNDLFVAGQLVPTKVSAIPVSTIATQFVHGEIVSGATGVGRVVIPTTATDTVIYIVVSVGGFTAEAITGSISGSATATGVEVDAGWSYKFDTSSCVRLSAQCEEDGLISQIYNAVPTFSISCENAGQIPKINYEISGVINSSLGVEQWMRDGAMTDLTGFRSEVIPPRFVDARIKYDAYSPVVDSTFTIDPAIAKTLRPDANNEAGAEGYALTGRAGMMSFRINTPTNAEVDFVQDWFNATGVGIEGRFGEEVGNTFWFFAPSARLENVTASDADGEMKQELQFKLTGQDDQELEIVCI
jgi:hypothetical protein